LLIEQSLIGAFLHKAQTKAASDANFFEPLALSAGRFGEAI